MALKIDDFRLMMDDWVRRFCVLIVVLCLTVTSHAQPSNTSSQSSIVNRKSSIFWAEGITRVEDLDLYAKCGLNTVVVRLPWRPTQDGSFTPEDLQPVKEFAVAATTKGLNVVYALPATPQGLEKSLRASADGVSYFALWSAWTGQAMKLLGNTPRLQGWMLPDDPRGLNYADDASFGRWLRRNYANVQVLNAQWSASFASFDAVTLPAVEALASQWRKNASGDDPLRDLYNAQGGTRNAASQAWAFHPATLAVAQFRWDAWRALVEGWAERVRTFDGNASHLVFSGRLPDYAQMLALPPHTREIAGVDVSIPDARPGFAEKDVQTHNPQAVAIARRGGRFRVVPLLQSEGSESVPGAQLPQLLPAWLSAHMAHGAGGAAFSSWRGISASPQVQRAIAESIARLSAPPYDVMWNGSPVSTTALVLTPLADAYQVQIEKEQRGIYGFGTDLVMGVPGDLVWMLRHGTAFGGVDFLAPEEVEDGGEALNRYATLLLPQALSLPDEEARALQRYASGGGVVVADLGAGALQNGGRVTDLSPVLRELFGVTPAGFPVRNVSGDLRLLEPHPLLPGFSGTGGNRNALLTAGDGPRGVAFSGPVAYFEPTRAQSIALLDQQSQDVADLNLGMRNRTARALLSVNGVGAGHALFAPFRLWSFWRPGRFGFDAFHGDLSSRGATLVMSSVASLVPAPPGGTAIYPETINYPNAIGVWNHGSTLAPCTVMTSGVGHFVWSDAVNVFANAGTSALMGGRPAPVEGADEFLALPHAVTLRVLAKPNELSLSRLRPVRVQNTSGGPVCVSLLEETNRSLKVNVWPNATETSPQNGEWAVTLAEAGTVSVQLWNAPDGYRITPGSRHRATITQLNIVTPPAPVQPNAKPNPKNPPPAPPLPTTRTVEVTADAKGAISLEATGRSLKIEMRPIS